MSPFSDRDSAGYPHTALLPRKLARLLDLCPSALMITNPRGVIRWVNAKFTALTGYAAREAVGQTPRLLQSGRTPRNHYDQLWAALHSGQEWHGELEDRKKSGQPFWQHASILPLKNSHGKITHFICLMEDISPLKHTIRELAAEQAALENILQAIPEPVIRINFQYQVTDMNQAALAAFGPESIAQEGHPFCYRLLHGRATPCEGRLHPCPLVEVKRRNAALTLHHRHFGSASHAELTEVVCRPEYDGEGRLCGIQQLYRAPQTAEIRGPELLESASRALYENPHQGVIVVNRQGRIQGFNPCFKRLMQKGGFKPIRPQDSLFGLFPAEEADAARKSLRRTLAGENDTATLRLANQWYEFCFCPARGPSGVEGAAILVRDITRFKTTEARLQASAFRDPLTELPNRQLFNDRCQLALDQARRHRRPLALMLLDLNHFKYANDTLGTPGGDRLLREVASRIGRALRRSDTLARMGGDELAILVTDVPDPRALIKIARKILSLFEAPFILEGVNLRLEASLGISLYPEDGDQVAGLLQCAACAVAEVKSGGRGGYKFHSRLVGNRIFEELSFEDNLRRALAAKEFQLYYQPVIHSSTGRVIGAEALMRWQHPYLGLLEAVDFLPPAEHSNLMADLGAWTLNAAGAQVRGWEKVGIRGLQIFMNVSHQQLLQADFPGQVRKMLREYCMPPDQLALEIRENDLARDSAQIGRVLAQLSDQKIMIMLDHFAQGSTRWAHLRDLPIAGLKIQWPQPTDGLDAAVDTLAAMHHLGHGLKKKVFALGVETQRHYELLAGLPSDGWQGFWFSRPVSGSDMPALMQRPADE